MSVESNYDQITNFETFQLWTVGYKVGLRDRLRDSRLAKSREWMNSFLSKISNEPVEVPLDPRLVGIPWSKVPLSLQQRLAMQYASASIDDPEKK